MADFDPDAFLNSTQPSAVEGATSKNSGFDPDAFLQTTAGSQPQQAKQAEFNPNTFATQQVTEQQSLEPEGPVAPQFVVPGPTGFNGKAVMDTAGAIARGAGNYVKNPMNIVTDVALAHMGVPPVAAAKSAYDTYQTGKDLAAAAAKVTSQFDVPKSLNTLYDPLKAALTTEHPELLKPVQEAFARSGPQGVKNILTSPETQKLLTGPATQEAAQAFLGGVPGVGKQIGRAVAPVLRGAGKVLGPAGLAMNAYDAAQYAEAAELGKRLAQGQGATAQHQFKQMNPGYSQQFNQQITPDQAQNILASNSERDIAAFGGRQRLTAIAQTPAKQVLQQPPTSQNFMQRMAALSMLYKPAQGQQQ